MDGASDCHIHVYDPRFPVPLPQHRPMARATVDDYRGVQARLGTRNVVVVQPAPYGTDNRVTVDAVARLGRGNARGIAVLHPDVTDAQLAELDAAGIVGLRFTQHAASTAVTTPEMIEPLARRIHALGWHVQLHLRAEQIVALRDVLARLPGTLVFDHMGRIPVGEGIRHPAFGLICRWLAEGRAWVKLAGPYLESVAGAPGYEDVLPVAREYVRVAPDRLVWGSDWPHPTERDNPPDDRSLLDLLADCAGDGGLVRRILVDNPRNLYGF